MRRHLEASQWAFSTTVEISNNRIINTPRALLPPHLIVKKVLGGQTADRAAESRALNMQRIPQQDTPK